MKRPHFIRFGPSIEQVPRKDFKSMRIKDKELEEVWSSIVGPSAELNIGQGLDMWKVITMAYLEGLSHGSALERESDPIKQYREVFHVKSRSQKP